MTIISSPKYSFRPLQVAYSQISTRIALQRNEKVILLQSNFHLSEKLVLSIELIPVQRIGFISPVSI